MQMSQLRPAHQFAQQYGVKSLVHGSPGTGKTPVANSAPRPVLCVVEPGMLSMRTSEIPTWGAFTPALCDEFFTWLKSSQEADNFDTVIVDSVSHMAEIYLKEEQGKNRDGRAAYGEMSKRVYDHLEMLFFRQRKHAYLITKQSRKDESGIIRKRPYFPGIELNTKVPHLYDLIMCLDVHNVPGHGAFKGFQCNESLDTVARDRSGKLDMFEPCDLNHIFNKAMQ